MKQVQEDEFTEHKGNKTQGEAGAYTFFALLCFLVAIIFLSIFLGNALNGISSMLVLLGVIAFGLGGIYLLGKGPSQKSVTDNNFPFEYNQYENDTDVGIVESTLVESVQDEREDDEAGDGNEAEPVEYDEDEDENENDEDEDEDEDFIRLVEEALDTIPSEFREKMENLVVLVEEEPAREVLQRVGTKEGYTLLGLYEGTPLTTQIHQGAMLPERIIIYQRTIEAYCHGNSERIRQQVRTTLLHEVAHHFGIDHEEMPIWIK